MSSQQNLQQTGGSSNQLVSREQGPMSITPQEREAAHESLDRLVDSGIGGSTHDPNVAAAFLEYAARKHILLTPIMGAFRLRPGWELAFTKLPVSTSKAAKLVYKVSDDDSDRGGGEWNDGTLLAFHKPLLYMIRTHLGIEITNITRIDDRSKDYCYEFKVDAEYLGVDGQIKRLVDQGGLDLSEGSPKAKQIIASGRGNSPEEKERKGRYALELKRSKVLQNATTNAEERVIQSYGFRGSYTKGELDTKLIVCVRPLYTGYHPDPEMQKILLGNMLQEQNSASRLLYGMGAGPSANAGLPPQISSGSPGPFEQQEQAAEVLQEPQFCSQEMCYGDESDKHIRACKGKGAGEVVEQQPWVIPEKHGEKGGFKINDPAVTDSDLRTLVGRYDYLLEPEQKANLQPEAVKQIENCLAQVWAEVRRREAANK